VGYEAWVCKIDDSIKCIPQEIATHVSIIDFGKKDSSKATHPHEMAKRWPVPGFQPNARSRLYSGFSFRRHHNA
jgi:hypothetical protein